LNGRVELRRQADRILMSINGEEVLNLPAAEFVAPEKPMGIRWLGASVKPCAQ
jgi:hypothetical protein